MILRRSKGLAVLHLQNPPIIHCDLKPANILVTDNCVGKLGDIGGAKELHRAMTVAQPGTQFYMPQEQYGRGSVANDRSNTYLFGIIIWEVFTAASRSGTQRDGQLRRLVEEKDVETSWPIFSLLCGDPTCHGGTLVDAVHNPTERGYEPPENGPAGRPSAQQLVTALRAMQ
eukprot:2876097-Prymnesium_polylepis.1